MKKTIFVSVIALMAFVGLQSCGSRETQPEVTACEEMHMNQPYYEMDYLGNTIFKGTKKVSTGWLHWDENKECPHQNGYTFRVLKNTPTRILKSDICDHCHYSWSLHDDK